MADVGEPLRRGFTGELEQLHLQVEFMAVRVDQNLDRVCKTLRTGDDGIVEAAFSDDDEIDAMSVSLTERCYDLLRLEAPVASDFRFVVSALRVISELERIGDLALRVIKLGDKQALLASNDTIYDLLTTMADQTVERYRTGLHAWAALDVKLARGIVEGSRALDSDYERIMDELACVGGADAIDIALTTFSVDRSLERIWDHSTIIAARLLYLLTGDPDRLVREVR